jgi:peptidoglycan/LPS O-acetylase OafA/YrhL
VAGIRDLRPVEVPHAGVERRPELDAIRLVVVLGLVFFHAALVFDTRDDYYIKNAQNSDLPTILAGFAVVWAMPALFLIAGFGAWQSLRRRGPGRFAVERLLRLGVPLVFATLTIIPVPVWLRLRAADPGYHESYLQFLRRFFDVHLEWSNFPFVVQGELFETGHLWFVVLLLTFALMLTPFVAWLPGERAGRVRDAIASAVGRRGVVLLPAIPVALANAAFGMEEGYAGWSRWAYLLFFVYGFVLAGDERFRAAMRRDAVLAAVVGVALFLPVGPLLLAAGGDPMLDMTPLALLARVLFGAAGWCWLVGILGLLDRRRSVRASRSVPGPGRSRWYGYLALAALPVYVLHQPILVVVGYVVIQWDAPSIVKYLAIVAGSFVLIFAVYDLLVRRTRVTRFLFGVREPRTAPAVPAPALDVPSS